MTFSKRGGGGHEIWYNFADDCGWFLGKGWYFSDALNVHVYKKKMSLFSSYVKLFHTFLIFTCYTASLKLV